MISTHWGWVTPVNICASKLTIIGSDNGLSPGWCQAIIWTNAELLFNGPLGTTFREILIEIHTFSFKKMHLKMLSVKWRLCCVGLLVLVNSLRPSDAYICVGKLTLTGSDNGLSPGRCQAINWTNTGLLSIRLTGTNFGEIRIGILSFSLKKMHLKLSSGKWQPFCLGLKE